MYESSIKEWLLAGHSKVYTLVVATYRQRLEDLKPTLFRKWLAKEINIEEEKVNLSSLHSALSRARKKEKKNKQPGRVAYDGVRSDAVVTASAKENFSFTNLDEKGNSKSRKHPY